MTRRFTAKELSFLRNRVPINHVVDTMLSVATGNDNGRLLFACPVCRGVNTAINVRHNLARCFDCRQNYNPIEFVMHQLHLSFVDSVKWIKKHRCHPVSEKVSSPQNPSAQPVSICDVLSGMLPSPSAGVIENPAPEALIKRISDLEHSVEKLDLLINEILLSIQQR